MVSYTILVTFRDSSNGVIGSGAVYSFDPVGSYEREACRAAGAAQSLVQPFLDNQVGHISIASDTPGMLIGMNRSTSKTKHLNLEQHHSYPGIYPFLPSWPSSSTHSHRQLRDISRWEMG
jgi:hypothetical protein